MQPVLDYLARNEQRFIDTLVEHASFPSISAQPQHKADVLANAEWLLAHCRAIGLDARLVKTPGHPVLLARTPRTKGTRKPHYLVYGHYDVQPPEPFELWKTEPFKPTVRGRSLFGRGTSDNKGQHLAHLNAVEAFLKTGTELPCDLTFVIEGEEEVGSDHLAGFLKQHRRELACDGVVISDTGIPSLKTPALTYALRGIAALEIKVHGPSRDLHSGLFGGSLENPAMALCQLLAQMRDANGRVTVPGFYDRVRPLSKLERAQARRFPLAESAYRKFLGVPRLAGEKGFSFIEHRSARPTFEINGLTSGYQGHGSKTIVPAWASAKITMRLVPDQEPKEILKLAARHLKRLCPPTVRLEIEPGHYGEPYCISPEGPKVRAALRAVRQAFGREPILMREGGSIPIVNDFKRILGVDTLLLGLALPDDNAHSPNEKFSLDCYAAGMRMGALLWRELGAQ